MVFCYQNCSYLLWEKNCSSDREYMFLLAGNIMPGAEKLWGELLFPEEKWLFFSTEGRKKQFFQGKQMFFSEFFCPRHNVFQPEGYIFLVFHPLTYHKPLHFDGFRFILPLQIMHNLLADRPAPRGGAVGCRGGDPPAKAKRLLLKYLKKGNYYFVYVTTFKIL